MSWKTKKPILLDHIGLCVNSELTPLGITLYQDGIRLKRDGRKQYKIKVNDGGDDMVTIISHPINGRSLLFRGETIGLDKQPGGFEIALTLLTCTLIFISVYKRIAGIGFIGPTGVFFFTIIAISAGFATLRLIQNQEEHIMQITCSLLTAVIGIAVYVGLMYSLVAFSIWFFDIHFNIRKL